MHLWEDENEFWHMYGTKKKRLTKAVLQNIDYSIMKYIVKGLGLAKNPFGFPSNSVIPDNKIYIWTGFNRSSRTVGILSKAYAE